MSDPIIEKLFREELKRKGERWSKTWAGLNDDLRVELLGKWLARRAIAEERAILAIAEDLKTEDTAPRSLDPELRDTRGPLGSDTGGGRRVIRSTKSLS